MRGTRTLPLKDNLPTDRVPLVTILLIVTNALVYFVVQDGGITSGPDASVADGSAGWVQVVASLFFSGGILHLLANAIFLWIFGISVEDSMTRGRYLLFYALGGLAAVGLHAALEADAGATAIGSTGAIAAVIAGHVALYPRARVIAIGFAIVFFALYELPTWLLLGLWLAVQTALTLADGAGAGADAASFAWLGGFVFGGAAVRLFAERRKALPGAPRRPTAAVGS